MYNSTEHTSYSTLVASFQIRTLHYLIRILLGTLSLLNKNQKHNLDTQVTQLLQEDNKTFKPMHLLHFALLLLPLTTLTAATFPAPAIVHAFQPAPYSGTPNASINTNPTNLGDALNKVLHSDISEEGSDPTANFELVCRYVLAATTSVINTSRAPMTPVDTKTVPVTSTGTSTSAGAASTTTRVGATTEAPKKSESGKVGVDKRVLMTAMGAVGVGIGLGSWWLIWGALAMSLGVLWNIVMDGQWTNGQYLGRM
ncbi:hypothetical protein B0J14DRAFT_563385 [Halenospora varia]|nr:hypothetical protein B0J14DRAFT_563385 [Halenospora varia]